MGSRSTGEGAENVYAAARQWVERALRKDDSLFTPGKQIWSSRWLEQIRERFLNRPDESGDSFYEKMEKQLVGSPPEVYQLIAEVLYVHFLIVWHQAMKASAKEHRINKALGWSEQLITIPDNLVASLTPGITHPGTAFNTYRPNQVGYLIEFADLWKKQSSIERERLLNEPWSFKQFLRFTPTSDLLRMYSGDGTYRAQREALLHLVFPDTFEGIVSTNHKKLITKAFAHLVAEQTDDIDRRMEQIRQSLEAKLGRDFRFHDSDIRIKWDPHKKTKAPKPNGPADPQKPEPALQTLAEELLLPLEFLEEIDTLLKEKKQVIFQGPPGTGKTFVAQKLAERLAGSQERVTLVQFHPSYAYEDFVQGYRPSLLEGQPGFELKDGPLLQAAQRASEDGDADHYLVIDEINRGNLAKVFGELYFLLEYRDQKMRLQYQTDKEFSLPENLYIIGTMNTADRSIALVDLALRRRFYFVEFHPDDEPIKDLLRNWLQANASDMKWVADVIDLVNKKLEDDRHVAIGPSYFMGTDDKGNAVVRDEASVRRIWKHSVLPYIEEHLFGNLDSMDEWDLDKLRKQTKTPTQESDGGDENPDQG